VAARSWTRHDLRNLLIGAVFIAIGDGPFRLKDTVLLASGYHWGFNCNLM